LGRRRYSGCNKKNTIKKIMKKKHVVLKEKLNVFNTKKILDYDYTSYVIYSVIMGIVVGFATVIFHESIDFFNELFFKQTAKGLYFLGAAAVIALPAIGMLIQSLMIYGAPEIAKNRGVVEVIKAVATKGYRIPLRNTIFHFIAPVISIGSGNTVGPEGPAAQLGGGLANKLAYLFNLSDTKKKVLTAAGSGAAIAAIFNTPMGGIFFALEIVLLNEFSTSTFPALILSSVTSSAVSRVFLGNKSVFYFSSPQVGDYLNLYYYAILGVMAGILSLSFIRYSNFLDNFISKKILKKIPRWVLMTFVGIIMGISGYFYKDIFGIGYYGINHILSSSLAWHIVAVLLILKFLLVPMILNSGGFGGIFAPSLFMGACLGFLYATGLNYLSGNQFDTTAFVLVAMGAVLGGINFIPISSILIIFEMTKDYSFILPLMLAVVTSTMIVQIILKKSIHERHLEKQGYRVSAKGEINLLKSLTAKQVMKNDIVLVKEDTPLPEIVKHLIESAHNTFYMIDDNGKITGTITETELRPIITEYEHIRNVLVARDVASSSVTLIREDETLDNVLKKFEAKGADEFPVVSASNSNKILGTISRHDVITAYNKESLKTDIVEGLSHELLNISKIKKTQVFEGYSILEKTAPPQFVGKSLIELKIRSRYGLEVLVVKKTNSPFDDNEKEVVVPDPNYIIQQGDELILFGSDDKIERALNW